MALDYDKMLDEAYSKLPIEGVKHERFEVPRIALTVFGSRTIFHNFNEVCDALNRDSSHVLRFISKEIATSGIVEGSRAIFQGKFESDTMERLIKHYVDAYITCPVCKRPDTKIIKEKRLHFLVCEACGARSPVKPV